MNQMQKAVHRWINQYKEGYWEPLAILARITEEAGELSKEVNHSYGPKKKKRGESNSSIAEELGDILFCLICMANRERLDLKKDCFDKSMAKCYGRDKDRFEKKDIKQKPR